MTTRYGVLARYNAWANHKLYAVAGALTDEDYRADRGAAFKSLHGTLNHLLVTDRLWLARFAGDPAPPYRLDTILFDDFAALDAARQAEDTRLISLVDGLDEAALAGTFRYTRASSTERYEQELAPALDHLFNHQTHHRGQAHAIVTAFGFAAPALDLLFFQREVGFGGMRRIA